MNAKDLYNMDVESSTKSLSPLTGSYYNFVPEINTDDTWLGGLENDKVVIKTVKCFYYDHRRLWLLQTVWYDNKPVMIIQNAGREGDDHTERFITDISTYKNMIEYINSLIVHNDNYTTSMNDYIDDHENIESLTNFYGQSLFGEFKEHSYY